MNTSRKQSLYFKTLPTSELFLQKAKMDVKERLSGLVTKPGRRFGLTASSVNTATSRPAIVPASIPAPAAVPLLTPVGSTSITTAPKTNQEPPLLTEAQKAESRTRATEERRRKRMEDLKKMFERTAEKMAQNEALDAKFHKAHFSPPVREMLERVKTMCKTFMRREGVRIGGNEDVLKNPSGGESPFDLCSIFCGDG